MLHRHTVVLLGIILFVAPLAVLATPGDTVTTFPLPCHYPQGLTFDGSHLWVADRMNDQLYEIDPADGRLIDSIPTPGYNVRGLTWDGTYLWTVDAEESAVYAIDPKTRIVAFTIYCPASDPCDLAWDGKYLWVADDGSDELLQISPQDGTTIVSLKAPTSHPIGLTFDGAWLWVTDRYKDEIYMVHPVSGDVVATLRAPGKHAWGLAWDGKYLWNVDYESDRLYKLVARDDTKFDRTDEHAEEIVFTHQVRNFGPDTLKSLDVYLAVPTDLNNQKLVAKPAYNPEPTDFPVDKWGQQVAHYHFTDLAAGEFTNVAMTNQVLLYRNRYYIFPEKVGLLKDIPKEITSRYLVDDAKFDLSNPVIRNAVTAAVGNETNPYWIARRIFNYVMEHLEYELAGGWNVAPAVLERGNGSCSEYTFVYIAMCRAAGIPARYAGSVAVRGDDASYDDVFHRWVEVYLPGYEWIPVDPSGGDSEWPANRARAFGFLDNRYLITTVGGGGSQYLEWSYNANERWTSRGRCKVVSENFGEWSPLEIDTQ